MSDFRDSEKHQNALNKLPEELRKHYDELAEQYRFHTIKQYGRGYVAYEVLASLVRDGWRLAAKPVK